MLVCLALVLSGTLQSGHMHAAGHEAPAVAEASFGMPVDGHGTPSKDSGGHERHPGCLAGPACVIAAPIGGRVLEFTDLRERLLPARVEPMTGRSPAPPLQPPNRIALG